MNQERREHRANLLADGNVRRLDVPGSRPVVRQLQLDLFDERNLVELSSPDYLGERLAACRNPDLAKLRAHKREELLAATDRNLVPQRCAFGACQFGQGRVPEDAALNAVHHEERRADDRGVVSAGVDARHGHRRVAQRGDYAVFSVAGVR